MDFDSFRIWYWVSTLILGFLLFRPAKKFIYVQKVRKAVKKLERELTDEEQNTIAKKAIPITAFIVITFAMFFNSVIMGKYYQ